MIELINEHYARLVLTVGQPRSVVNAINIAVQPG
ncbi:hypothetical protein H4V99_001163 [Cryobacterium sp. CG_9.6]|nr:hypothetical protein [Cryobacterium sp. CG_9.6]